MFDTGPDAANVPPSLTSAPLTPVKVFLPTHDVSLAFGADPPPPPAAPVVVPAPVVPPGTVTPGGSVPPARPVPPLPVPSPPLRITSGASMLHAVATSVSATPRM